MKEDKEYSDFHICQKVLVNKKNETIEVSTYVNPTDFSDSWSFRFCAGYDKNVEKKNIFYFFHGLSGEPENFLRRKSIGLIRHYWRKSSSLPPWVSVSFGRTGLISKPKRLKRFEEVVIPYIEKTILGFSQEPEKRFALGVSMGGANVLHVTQKSPQIFHSAFLVCPAVSLLSPNSDKRDFLEYTRRTGAYLRLIMSIPRFLPTIFFNNEYYDSIDPFGSGQMDFNEKTPAFYIQTSSRDQFGFQEGGRILAFLARKKGVDVSFDELHGGHCVLEPKTAVKFFERSHQGSKFQK